MLYHHEERATASLNNWPRPLGVRHTIATTCQLELDFQTERAGRVRVREGNELRATNSGQSCNSAILNSGF